MLPMTISVKYFASLREQLGRSEDQIEFLDNLTVDALWNMATNNHARPDTLLVAINQEYAQFNDLVSDHDEVAFFPPVTGG